MKTQISRWSDAPQQRRSGIYQQQGRMISDADWNELMELLKRRIDAALGDVIGSGAPRQGSATALLERGAAGSGVPSVKRSPIYVDGIRAHLEGSSAGTGAFALTQQADFPAPPPFPAAEQYLYVDVWELPVTALEDASLLDPGLHGSDTTTRTQTLAQVKWSAVVPGASLTPLEDPNNPSKGDAVCRVELLPALAVADPCDACAAEIALERRIGNHVFRVEVHDVVGSAAAPSEITLKWSAENAAEHCAQSEVPPQFKRADWIYEFYNATTERHLGVHLVPGFSPARALLREGWPRPSELPDPAVYPFVRRWDGYARLLQSAAGWSIASVGGVLQGSDRGRRLQVPAPNAAPAHGHFGYSAPEVTFHLSGMKLGLTLDGKKLVAGDYWLAVVREDAEPAARVQLASATPLGITHHYLLLGSASGEVPVASSAHLRRLSFPKLTELSADRIAYAVGSRAARWSDVLENAVALPQDVQQAIDQLVEQLDGSDLTLQVSTCGASGAATVRSLLELAGGPQKLDAVFGKLLCELTARHLPIDKNDTTLAPIFNPPAVVTVQQGLSVLGSALTNLDAEATVGPGGRYATLAAAFGALAAADNVALCLLPGVHDLSTGASLTNKRSIRLSGVSGAASRIHLGAELLLGAREVVLRDLAVIGQGTANVVLQADRTVAQGCSFARATLYSAHAWSRRFGGTFADSAQGIVTDASGNMIVVGRFAGTINFSGTAGAALVSAGSNDLYVAKLDPQGGHIWSKRFGSSGDDRAVSVAVDPAGNVIVAGTFTGSIVFGTQTHTAGLVPTMFLVKLDASGVPVWSKAFFATPTGVAVDAAGSIVLTGFYQTAADFGGGALPTGGSLDVVVAKYNAAGVHQWSKGFIGANVQQSSDVACDGSGNVLVTGGFQGSTNFSGITLTAAANLDAYLVKLSGASGAAVWAKQFAVPNITNSGSSLSGMGVAADGDGNIVLTGYFDSTINLGGGNYFSLQPTTFLAKFDAAGAHLWSKCFAAQGTGSSQGARVRIDGGGNVIVSGLYAGNLNLAGTQLPSIGTLGNDIYLARFGAAGNLQWARRFGSNLEDFAAGLAVDPGGNVLMAGTFTGSIDFGGSTLSSPTGSDVDLFVAKLVPEPVLKPLVEIRPRDPARGADLVWSQNEMLASVVDGSTPRQLRTALALATPNIGGEILDNTIQGRLLLQSDLPFNVEGQIATTGITGVGGGAYLTVRGNVLGRIVSRYENTAPRFDALGTLLVTDNTLLEAHHGLIGEQVTLSNNQLLTQAATDVAGVVMCRFATVVGNQAAHPEAQLLVTGGTLFGEAGNALTIQRTIAGLLDPVVQPAPWYWGGAAAELL